MEKNIKDILFENPLYLDITPEVEEVSNFYLPYSTGFEVECYKSDNFDINNFKNIPYIMDVDIDSSEQRFRIPSGIRGLKCLFNISEQLCLNSEPTESGVHYHIDFTDSFHRLNKITVEKVAPFILKELDTWNYTGTYNTRSVAINSRMWVNFQSGFKTMEVRIGEMTFDYKLLLKRIVHCNYIAKMVKSKLELYEESSILEEDNVLKGFIEEEKIANRYDDDIRSVIRNRVKK